MIKYKIKKSKNNKIRSKQIKKFKCPGCGSFSLREVKKNKKVWAECNNCLLSGQSNELSDNYLMEGCDIYFMLVDSYHDKK